MSRTLGIRTITRGVAVAGVPIALSPTKLMTSFVRIRAKLANAGTIYYSNEDVSTSSDYLGAGDSISIDGAPITSATHPQYDLSKIFIDASSSGDGVIVTYQSYDD